MSIPFLPIHPHPNGLMSKTNRRRLRRQQAGATASQGGPDFMSPEDQFRMSLDTTNRRYQAGMRTPRRIRASGIALR